ncbi:MAG: monovalent cation/H(+) antiporter subunit G [Chloroflexi bacterium]|nr:monovalent cation/H(+) antiporter subunit G [Chloroflexota bacterium]
MEIALKLFAITAIVVGTAFSVLGIIGYKRMPDVYTRMHATGKVSTFGVVLLLIAAVAITPIGWAKALLLVALIWIAGPVVSHAIGSAALRIGIPMKNSVRDDLQEKRGDMV